ncbi:unnamed protein product [Schistosoma curassoni]|uniref:Leishmanolysin-like peptidase n=1 Tax=Schistosoma curassoni TaxID=6186 RepID=A0A183KMT4_9TREM|nr:unnamed protein product [Schistosoma curassoni]
MKIYKFVLLCIVLLKSVTGKRDQQVVQEQQKRSLTNKQLQIILVYDEDLEQNQAFPKIKSCYHQGKEKYGIVYSQGTGLAPNQLLIIVADSSRTRIDECTHVRGELVDTHPSTGRPILGVLNYCLPEKESITISDDILVNVMKHETAHILVSSFQFMKYGLRTLTYG